MFTANELQSFYDINKKIQRYEKCLTDIHTAQSKNYQSFQDMVKDLQDKAFNALN